MLRNTLNIYMETFRAGPFENCSKNDSCLSALRGLVQRYVICMEDMPWPEPGQERHPLGRGAALLHCACAEKKYCLNPTVPLSHRTRNVPPIKVEMAHVLPLPGLLPFGGATRHEPIATPSSVPLPRKRRGAEVFGLSTTNLRWQKTEKKARSLPFWRQG